MKPSLVLTRIEQLRALADPLRLRIVEALSQHELSVGQLAKALETPAARLYHHIDLMLEAGIIEVTRRIPRRGTEERILRAAARDFTLDRGLFGGDSAIDDSAETVLEMGRSILSTAADELGEGVDSGRIRPGVPGRGVLLHERSLALTPDAFAEIVRRIPGEVDAIAAAKSRGRRTSYRMIMVAYPIAEPRPSRSRRRSTRSGGSP